MRSSTSRPSASWGMTSARTNEVTSMRGTPVRASASMSRTLSSVARTSGSFWNPSRGPTSRIRTAPGSSIAQAPSARAMTICCTSSVPSPIVRIFASR